MIEEMLAVYEKLLQALPASEIVTEFRMHSLTMIATTSFFERRRAPWGGISADGVPFHGDDSIREGVVRIIYLDGHKEDVLVYSWGKTVTPPAGTDGANNPGV